MKILTSCVLLIFLLLHSCCRSSSQLEEALIAAKDNRQELEKVLFHYEHDSLKLKSAEFLIRNMPAHNSYVGEGINKYYDAVDSILNLGIGIWEKRDALDKMTPNYISVFKTASDVDIITADFLILIQLSRYGKMVNGPHMCLLMISVNIYFLINHLSYKS